MRQICIDINVQPGVVVIQNNVKPLPDRNIRYVAKFVRILARPYYDAHCVRVPLYKDAGTHERPGCPVALMEDMFQFDIAAECSFLNLQEKGIGEFGSATFIHGSLYLDRIGSRRILGNYRNTVGGLCGVVE